MKIFLRFANIFRLKNIDTVVKTVKTVKSWTSTRITCDNIYKTMYTADDMLSQVKRVEQELDIEASDQINKKLTKEELKTAGEMFLYLNTCPDRHSTWFKSWKNFYHYLFFSSSTATDEILLTLNRLMKAETSPDKDAKARAEKLLKKATSLLSLQYERIQSLMPGKMFTNGSVFNDSMIPKGINNISYFALLYFIFR